jgi:nucleotide-binding universal stress UspA family protein
MTDNVIVVGIDGSTPSKAALEWALREAALRDARVRAVGVVDIRMVPSAPLVGPVRGDLVGAATAAIDDAVAQAQQTHSNLLLEREVTTGHPAKVLIDRSEDAELLVVGRRGHSMLAGLLMGSVASQVSAHADCPVVVVHGSR